VSVRIIPKRAIVRAISCVDPITNNHKWVCRIYETEVLQINNNNVSFACVSHVFRVSFCCEREKRESIIESSTYRTY
jgi:hypothetical protein